jgi:N-acetylglucosamine-6-phosphate deacetylase
MLISQPGSDYQLTQIALDAGHARDITLMLLDIHSVLDQFYLDGTQTQITAAAEAVLRESGSPYTLPTLISALAEVIDQLTRATRHAAADIPQPQPNP